MLYNQTRKTGGNSSKRRTIALLISVTLSIGLAFGLAVSKLPTKGDKQSQADDAHQGPLSYIISGKSVDQLVAQLQQMDVVPTHKLSIINSVAARLTGEQVAQLMRSSDIKITKNYQVKAAASGLALGNRRWQPSAVIPDFIQATDAHQRGNYGGGVTIGFLDTGLDNLTGLQDNLYGNDKYWGTYDAINDVAYNTDNELNGHGTHVASIAGNSDYDINGKIYGVAPNALLVGIKAFDAQGKSTYADLIRGVQWALAKKDDINLRVLNMSFSGPVHTYYWEDPLNIAIMKAWQAGIVIVTSAGNRGPNPMTIGVPANIPYVITVGAMTDNYTPTDISDDRLASFSSTGPTVEGHIKPEIIAPGGHMSGLMDADTYIATNYPDFHDGGSYYEMSGTSQAAGVVSGIAALLLTADPTLTPDDVKCRLIAGALTAFNGDGSLAYSVFQQGAGLVNVKNSLASTVNGCANKNMDIAMDIAGQEHYFGPAAINADGDIYLTNKPADYMWDIPADLNSPEGTTWRDAIKSLDGFIWDPAYSPSNTGFIWDPANAPTNDGFIWDPAFATSSAYSWRSNYETDAATIMNATFNTNSGYLWEQGFTDVTTQSIGVNHWVDQE